MPLFIAALMLLCLKIFSNGEKSRPTTSPLITIWCYLDSRNIEPAPLIDVRTRAEYTARVTHFENVSSNSMPKLDRVMRQNIRDLRSERQRARVTR